MTCLISGFSSPNWKGGVKLDTEKRFSPLRLLHDALLSGSIHGPSLPLERR